MEVEATAAAERATAKKRAAAVCADVSSFRGQEIREEDEALTLATDLERREDASRQVLQGQRERRMKMMVRQSDSLTLTPRWQFHL